MTIDLVHVYMTLARPYNQLLGTLQYMTIDLIQFFHNIYFFPLPVFHRTTHLH